MIAVGTLCQRLLLVCVEMYHFQRWTFHSQEQPGSQLEM